MFTTKKLAELKKCLSKRDRLSDTDQRMFHSITTNSSKAPLLRGFATTFSPGIASAICTIFSKFFSFCTRLQNHPILSTPTTPDNSLNVLDYRDSSRIHILLLSDSKTILNKMQVYLFSFLFVLSFHHTLFCHYSLRSQPLFITSLQFFQNLSNIFIHANRFSRYFRRCICFTLVQ